MRRHASEQTLGHARFLRMGMAQWLGPSALVLGSLAPASCGDEIPKHAVIIDPVYSEPCKYMSCSNHGQCVEGEDGAPSCLCDVGYGRDRCQTCEAGFHWDARQRCAPDKHCADLTVNPCGTAGSCDDTDGVIACHCDTGYEGPRCTLCATGYRRDAFGDCLQVVIGDASCAEDSCSGHGSCDDTGGTVRCSCEAGYAGSHCGSCAAGFARDASDRCVPLTSCGEGACAGHGSCEQEAGTAHCSCAPGYAGQACERCAAGYHTQAGVCVLDQQCLDGTCAGHGACKAQNGKLQCACESAYAGARCEECAEGHHRGAGELCVPDEQCGSDLCGTNGSCSSEGGVAVCVCSDGWAGDRCDHCEQGFHATSTGCVRDQRCAANSCPASATCADGTGVVLCTCKVGYTGELCESCALGFKRDAAHGTCVPIDCHENPGPPAGRVDFDDIPGFPTFENNCLAGVNVDSKDVIFTSIGGDGTLWSCAPNTLYGIPSDHIFVEAGQQGLAEIRFSGPIGQLSFRYGARSELGLEISADGQVIGTLNAGRRTNGTQIYTFNVPITLFSLRSINGTTNQLALDEVTYAPPVCP